MTKAVIFDRDGVLIDSEYTNVKSADLAFGEMGIELTEHEKELIVGRHPADYSIPLMKKYDFNYEEFREIQREKYIQILESTPVFEQTVNFAKQIHRRGIPVAICTSSNRTLTDNILEDIGIKNLFSTIVTKEDYSKRKPDPEPYLTTAVKLGIDPKDCLVIEDSEIGLKSALNAGMKCIVIYNEYTKNHDFKGALKVVGTASELNLEEILD